MTTCNDWLFQLLVFTIKVNGAFVFARFDWVLRFEITFAIFLRVKTRLLNYPKKIDARM